MLSVRCLRHQLCPGKTRATLAIMQAWSLSVVRAAFSVLSLIVVSCGGNADVPSAPSTLVETAQITVVEVNELMVTAPVTEVVVGATTTVTATASYSDGTTAVVMAAWQSSAEAVATVTPAGVVTGVSAGTTTVTGTFEGTSGSVTVTVTAPASTTWRGLLVADENRCSEYSPSNYSYPQSVEDDIIGQLGGIYSPYTGECFASQSETDIEHMIARSEAHDSGLCSADASTRAGFSRDLDNLTLASPSLNRYEKVAKDAADWLPSQNSCWFAASVVAVRLKYGLTIDQREADALEQVLAGCASTALVPTDCTATPDDNDPDNDGSGTVVGVVINEFRTRGPAGGNDEFIELRNDSSASVEISGWQVHGSNSSGGTTNRRTMPSGTVLAAGCHYLLGNSRAYTGATDTTYGTGITDSGGIALKQANGSVVDQVGLSTGSAFYEGTPVASFPSGNSDRSYARATTDTDNNASDFSLIAPSTPLTSAASCAERVMAR